MADCKDLKRLVLQFRVVDLQVLLAFVGQKKSGIKKELLGRTFQLLHGGCSLVVELKIKSLYMRLPRHRLDYNCTAILPRERDSPQGSTTLPASLQLKNFVSDMMDSSKKPFSQSTEASNISDSCKNRIRTCAPEDDPSLTGVRGSAPTSQVPSAPDTKDYSLTAILPRECDSPQGSTTLPASLQLRNFVSAVMDSSKKPFSQSTEASNISDSYKNRIRTCAPEDDPSRTGVSGSAPTLQVPSAPDTKVGPTYPWNGLLTMPSAVPESLSKKHHAHSVRLAEVRLNRSPFHELLDEIVKLRPLVSSNVNHRGEADFVFSLTLQQATLLSSYWEINAYTTQVHLRFCLSETRYPQEDCFPDALSVTVNGVAIPLQRRPPSERPINITQCIYLSLGLQNCVTAFWTPNCNLNYSVSIELVKQLTPAFLLQRLVQQGIWNPEHSRALVREKLKTHSGTEVATTGLRVSLICPLGKMRMDIPCRGFTCSHLQCFDTHLYLQMNKKKPTWLCPICDREATYDVLVIDGLLVEILNSCPDADEIQFLEDGSWRPFQAKNQRQGAGGCNASPTGSTTNKQLEVVDLTLESSSDDGSEPVDDGRATSGSRNLFDSRNDHEEWSERKPKAICTAAEVFLPPCKEEGPPLYEHVKREDIKRRKKMML